MCVLLAAGIGLFIFRLGTDALIDYDEATYAQVFAEAVRSSDFISFTRLSQPWFEKPPFYFWMMAASSAVFGISEFAMRLPAALAGIGTVMLVWLIARIHSRNEWIACLAGAILLSTGTFLSPSRQIRMDVPVAFFLLLAFYCRLKGKDHPLWYLGIGITCAMGVLMKSVIGFFVFPILIIASIAYRDWRWLKSAYTWFGAGAMLALLLPWHLYESARFGSAFWNEYLFHHVLKRFSHPILGGNVSTLSYIKLLFRFAEPWIPVFLIAAAATPALKRTAPERYRTLAAIGWIIAFIFLTFAVARTKLLFYLVPIYPFMALSIALTAEKLYERLRDASQRELFAAACMVLIGIGLARSLYYEFSPANDIKASAEDERHIGQILAAAPADAPIRALGYLYWETIQYYSNGKKITSADIGAPGPEHFFLIIPSDMLEQYPFPQQLATRSTVRFRGSSAALIEVAPK